MPLCPIRQPPDGPIGFRIAENRFVDSARDSLKTIYQIRKICTRPTGNAFARRGHVRRMLRHRGSQRLTVMHAVSSMYREHEFVLRVLSEIETRKQFAKIQIHAQL